MSARQVSGRPEVVAFRVQAGNLLLLAVATVAVLVGSMFLPAGDGRSVLLMLYLPLAVYYGLWRLWRWRPLPESGSVRSAALVFGVVYTGSLLLVTGLYVLVLEPGSVVALGLAFLPAVPGLVGAWWLWRQASVAATER